MPKFSEPRWLALSNRTLDQCLCALSTYILPIVMGLLTAVALLGWPSDYPAASPEPLKFQLTVDEGDALTPGQAVDSLKAAVAVSRHDTRLSEKPIWFSFSTPPDASATVIEMPSRHAIDVSCWDAGTLKPLGHGDLHKVEGAMSSVKAGFALTLEPSASERATVCRASFVGPARMTLARVQPIDLKNSTEEFHRNSGLLDGGLLVLAIFVLITAVINRNLTYLLFSAWLVANLRMGALSAGWDSQWLGHAIPPDALPRMRLVTVAIYYTITITLFKALFREDLAKVGYGALLRFAQWTCLPLLLLSVWAPHRVFLPYVWVAASVNSAVLVFLLARILLLTRSSVALWYSASIAITLAASIYEVIAAALGVKGMIGAVNSVTAALSSSLLASLAIAEQMRLEHKQWLDAKAEMDHTFEAMPIGLFTLDMQGRFLSANPALMKMLSPSVLEPGTNDWQRYFSEGAWTKLHYMVHTETDGEIEIKGERLPRLGAKRFLVKATLARERIEGSLQDVTEKSRAEDDLQFLANNDPLTKVLNRRGIEKVFSDALAQLAQGKPLTLAYVDLDRFKLINDLYGHNAGDEVLQQVCERVENMLSGDMRIGRVGGDEFVIVMPDTKVPLAELICRGIVDSIGTVAYKVGDKAFHVRGSIGLIEVGPETQMKDAVSTADRACREAKMGNSDGLVVYEKNARAFRDHEAELKLVARLATPHATDGLFVEMQPIMSLKAPHDSLNFEVLLRMRDEDGQLVPTDRLIGAGENSGRMSVIDRWVLSTVLEWLNANSARLPNTKFVCMNLSGASLNDEKFMQDVFALLAQNIHVASHLCIEITESVALHDLDNTRKFIDRVRSFGAKVALDDFGAGYTSFSYLKKLTADLLKIDGSFIVNMNSHPANVAIVEAIVNLAGNLGMKTIAEWAEDNATVHTLTEIGVDYVQGFAVARPQSPDLLLTAPSSASFIKDEALAHYVRQIGQAEVALSQVDLFDMSRDRNVH